MGYGAKLKQYRLYCGMTAEEAAEKIGVAVNTLLSYEKDIGRIPVTEFVKLAELYGFDVFDVLGVHDMKEVIGLRGLIYDAEPEILVKAHFDAAVRKEQMTDLRFGNELPPDYYDDRRDRLIEELEAQENVKL